MRRTCFLPCLLLLSTFAASLPAFARHQDTGFLNRQITVAGEIYKYEVYLPEQWSHAQKWPVILFLHGSGERGSDGIDETQVGLPAALRAHPERWPFIVVMPQVPYNHRHWTDPDLMRMALAALDAEIKEFRGDRDRVYLTGLSLGGYGVWEIAKSYPGRFAAVVPVCGGIFWSYAPSRWKVAAVLPGEYARSIGRTPIWIFHGADDPVVVPKQAELMYQAMKAAGGDVRYWKYAGWKHNVWEKAYAEPEVPQWLLRHHLEGVPASPMYAERVLVPVHPVPVRVDPEIYDAYAGEYADAGVVQATIYRQGDGLYLKDRIGRATELLPESATTFFYPSGGPSRITFEKSANGEITGILYRDDRHEEHWEKRR